MINIFARISEKQKRASELREELERSLKVQQTMPHLFTKGAFGMSVTAKQTRAARLEGLRNLPYKAHITYVKSKAKVNLSYAEWAVLSRQYFSPQQHKGIERYWEM